MEKSHPHENNDILDEPYKGPGPIAASAGYVSLYHWVAMVVGFLAFGALGSVAEKETNAVKNLFTDFSLANKSSSNGFQKASARVAGWVTRSADYIASKVVGLGKKVVRGGVQTNEISEQKLSAIMFAGGVGGAAGWIGSTILGLIQGGHEGSIGKRQFNRAKAEIKDLRERNDELEKANDTLRKKHGEVTADKEDTAPTIADADDKVEHHTHHEKTLEHTHHSKPEHSIHAHSAHGAEHHGKLHAHAPHEQVAHSPA